MARISIRSIRYRRPLNPTWDAELEQEIRCQIEGIEAPLDFTGLFQRQAPVHVEIGFGKGRFLLAAAERFPETNWLGIEYAPPCVALAAERAARKGLRNVRIARGVAEDIIAARFPADTVAAYHIYFPDPWPKKRHHKRRLIKPPFAAQLARTLEPEGFVNTATDNSEYFEEIIAACTGAGLERREVPDTYADDAFRTNFEMRFLAHGQPVYRAAFRKPDQ